MVLKKFVYTGCAGFATICMALALNGTNGRVKAVGTPMDKATVSASVKNINMADKPVIVITRSTEDADEVIAVAEIAMPKVNAETPVVYADPIVVEESVSEEEWTDVTEQWSETVDPIVEETREYPAVEETWFEPSYVEWDGQRLTAMSGIAYGPSGKETYYNLNMSGVVSIMRNMGYDEGSYPYWVREDGCKMLGSYIMVAANLNAYPRGSIIPTSLGDAMVCDTGSFTTNGSGVSVDIATAW